VRALLIAIEHIPAGSACTTTTMGWSTSTQPTTSSEALTLTLDSGAPRGSRLLASVIVTLHWVQKASQFRDLWLAHSTHFLGLSFLRMNAPIAAWSILALHFEMAFSSYVSVQYCIHDRTVSSTLLLMQYSTA